MQLSAKAKTAYLLWSHYQQALVSGNFKDELHKTLIKDGEQLWRQRYLNETEEHADVIMKKAGCQVSSTGNGSYCIPMIFLIIMQINGSAFSCWILN